MSITVTYRTAAILLLLFALGHQLGFRKVDPAWRVEDLVRAMQATQFTVQGFARTYWGFFSGFGFFVTVLLLFSAVLAWVVGGVRGDLAGQLRPALWAFAIGYVVIAVLTWKYFFVAPGIFATVIPVLLLLGAYQAGRVPTTPGAIQTYFDRLERKDGWESSFADQVAFPSFTSPPKHVQGREAFLQATQRFYSAIGDVQVRDTIVDGDRACVLTRYTVRPPNGAPAFESDVAEILSVRNDKITSLGIYFDTAPYPK